MSTPDEQLMIRATAALSVLTLDPKIKEWLQQNDPKAYEQAEDVRRDLLIRTGNAGRAAWGKP